MSELMFITYSIVAFVLLAILIGTACVHGAKDETELWPEGKEDRMPPIRDVDRTLIFIERTPNSKWRVRITGYPAGSTDVIVSQKVVENKAQIAGVIGAVLTSEIEQVQ